MCMMKSSRKVQALKFMAIFQDFCPVVLSKRRNHWAQNNLKWRKSMWQVLKAIYFFFFFLDAKCVSISRKANDDKTDKKRKSSKNCSFFIISSSFLWIFCIFICLATPFLLFKFFGKMQSQQTVLEKSTRNPTTEEFHLLVDAGKLSLR